eukprot:363083-Chlamydomonas_euryale.AAC.3
MNQRRVPWPAHVPQASFEALSFSSMIAQTPVKRGGQLGPAEHAASMDVIVGVNYLNDSYSHWERVVESWRVQVWTRWCVRVGIVVCLHAVYEAAAGRLQWRVPPASRGCFAMLRPASAWALDRLQ